MGETPTLLTCAICGEKSLRIHNFVACIDALKESLAAANARAEKAEARSNKLAVFLDEVYVLNRSLIRARDAADKALAAARRECEGLRKALNSIEEALTDCGYTDYGARIAAIKALEDHAALASPAAGDSK